MEKVELPHVYKVKAGERIEDYICDKDGYIWFDEAGLLGASMVYDTLEQANKELNRYGDWLYNQLSTLKELK
jgi:sugar lactone lactonase YvrE